MKHIKNLLAHKHFYLWLAGIWTLLIIFLCLISAKDLPHVPVIKNEDKYVHFTFHFVFTVLWFLYLQTISPGNKKTLIKVFLASLIFGICIEFAQSIFTTTRKGDIMDVLANTSGAISAVASVIFYTSYIKKKTL